MKKKWFIKQLNKRLAEIGEMDANEYGIEHSGMIRGWRKAKLISKAFSRELGANFTQILDKDTLTSLQKEYGRVLVELEEEVQVADK